MVRRRLLAACLALAATGCGGSAPPATTAAPTTAAPRTGAPTAPAPTRPALPPVEDVTGLRAVGLVAADAIPLPGAGERGAAQLSVPTPGGSRPYLLAPARRVRPGTPPALLLVLPAANTKLRTEYERYGLDAFRDHGFAVAVVSTVAASWNAGSCCGRAQARGVDDVAAVTAVRADAARRAGADASRTALLGHSVGAFMAWRLACTPAFGAAVVVAVSGTLVHPCPQLPRTPKLLALNGRLDRTVPLDGSTRRVRLLGVAPPSVRRSLAAVAAAGGCGAATAARTGSSAITQHDGCRGGGSLRLQVVLDQGHQWEDLVATRRAAAFLDAALPGIA